MARTRKHLVEVDLPVPAYSDRASEEPEAGTEASLELLLSESPDVPPALEADSNQEPNIPRELRLEAGTEASLELQLSASPDEYTPAPTALVEGSDLSYQEANFPREIRLEAGTGASLEHQLSAFSRGNL